MIGKMSAFQRGMIFATFFGACFAIVLLVASLGTEHWAVARAKRTENPDKSDGLIHFGLFEGKKKLNVAYGLRVHEVDVIDLIKSDPDFLIYGYWLGTVVCVCAGLLFTGLSGLFAAVNAATTPSDCITGLTGLYLWNFLALIVDVGALGFWLAQFYLSIQYNVMSSEDKLNTWTSEGMAELGYSFWFVVGAALMTTIDIIIIYIGSSASRKVQPVYPVLEEKTNGAIMLY